MCVGNVLSIVVVVFRKTLTKVNSAKTSQAQDYSLTSLRLLLIYFFSNHRGRDFQDLLKLKLRNEREDFITMTTA